MASDTDPIVGNWYQHWGKGQKFEVVAVDEDTGLVEVQYFDGTVDEFALNEWDELDVETIEQPEDWTGSLDDIEQDDLGYTETGMEPEDWSEPLRGTERSRGRESEVPEEAEDDWGEGYPEEEPSEGED
jgi:hypothetical protein